MIKVHIADSNVLIREGLKALLKNIEEVIILGESVTSDGLFSFLKANNAKPDIIIIDYNSEKFKVEDILRLSSITPTIKLLAITEMTENTIVINALKAGIDGHLLNCCDFVEIRDALFALMKGDKFYCGKLLSAISGETLNGTKQTSCDPISLSERELEIIKYISEGLTNKEIADRIFLSTHTVMTHRKNIMNKLGVNNTAGIVIYAVKENMISPNKFLFASTIS